MTSEASHQIEHTPRNELFAWYVYAREPARRIRVVPSYLRVPRTAPADERKEDRSSPGRKPAGAPAS
jgi:hypothetical protein